MKDLKYLKYVGEFAKAINELDPSSKITIIALAGFLALVAVVWALK